MFSQPNSISWKFTGQPYDLNSVLTPDQVWTKLDAPPEDVRQALIALINALNAATASASVGFSPNVNVDVNANTVQLAFDALANLLHGTGGAAWLKSVGVAGLTGDNVQALLESLKSYVDNNFTTKSEITTNRKLSATGDFTGTLNGAAITAAEPGLSSAFNAHLEDAMQRGLNVMYPPSPLVAARGDGSTDDTAVLSAIATAYPGATLIFPHGHTFLTDGLTLGVGTRILGYGAVLKGRSGTGNVLTLVEGCSVYGLEINGNKAVKTDGHGIYAANVGHLTVRDCYIHDTNKIGIELATCTVIAVENNRLEGTTTQAIDLTYCTKGRISNNAIYNCGNGIQWWGGDGAVSDVRNVFDITITGNTIDTITAGAGIWGSLGERIAVTGNTVINCSDVGIDFENTWYSTCTGNIVKKCLNGCIATFYGGGHIAISGNTLYTDTDNTYGIYLHLGGTKVTKYLSITGNNITVINVNQYAIHTDAGAASDSLVEGNFIYTTATTIPAVKFLECDKINFIGNKVICSSATGLSIEGGSNCLIADNSIETTSDASALGAAGGIWIYWRSAGKPAQANTIKGNVISGFITSINDNCWGDSLSLNWMDGNRCLNIYHHGTAGVNWYGAATNNVTIANPNTASSVVSY